MLCWPVTVDSATVMAGCAVQHKPPGMAPGCALWDVQCSRSHQMWHQVVLCGMCSAALLLLHAVQYVMGALRAVPGLAASRLQSTRVCV